jgi:ATP-binding cassette, subfamily B, bacterial
MTSLAEAATPAPDTRFDRLPPMVSSMWRLCKIGYRHEPRLMAWAFVLSQLSALPDALMAVWLMLLGKGVLEHRSGLVLASAIGLGVSATATWFLRTSSTRVQRRFRDKVTIALESHVARLQATVGTIAHHERPDYLDRLAMLRDQVFVLDHMYMSLFSTLGWILRLVVTVGLLVSVHPALVLLALAALPTVITSAWRPGVDRAVYEKAAQPNRLARHLFTVATTASPGKEVRVTGIGPSLVTQRRHAWEFGHKPVAAVRWRSAMWHTLAWAIFGGAYVGAIVFVSRSDSFAVSGRTVRGGSPGSKTTPPRLSPRRISRCRLLFARAFGSITCRLRIQAHRDSCSTTCRCCSNRMQWSPSLARTAPARRRS